MTGDLDDKCDRVSDPAPDESTRRRYRIAALCPRHRASARNLGLATRQYDDEPYFIYDDENSVGDNPC
jgi:hypothetical protein